MPFLRFTRDKRGYETTALVHAFRGRHGRTRQKLLYWFRTPPSVKVGRPALDEEAIRWIEEHNPEIDFDWQKILEATPPPAPQAEDQKGRRGRRGKTERRPPGSQRPAQPRQRQPPAPVAKPEIAVAEAGEAIGAIGRLGESETSIEAAEGAPEEHALGRRTHPETDARPPDTRSPVETVVGGEQLFRIRAQYAELQARIAERGGDAARVEELRAQAEPLNPDSWVTAGEAKKGLEDFHVKIRDLRTALGLKRRRRSRRGGRRRRAKQPGQDTRTSSPASSSNLPDGPALPDEPAKDTENGG